MRGLVAMAVLVALAACNGAGSPGGGNEAAPSGEQGSRSFALDGFDRVELAGPDNVEVMIGEGFAVTAEGDTGILERLEIEVVDSELRIGRKRGGLFSGGGSSVLVRVTMPAIRGADIAGSGDMRIDRVAAENFDASIAGAGDLTIGQIEASQVSFDIAGSGNITAAGTASRLEIGLAGAGNVSARELRTETLDVEIAGAGDVEAFATGTAHATIIGAGDVTVLGGAECTSESLGAGELRCE